MLFVARFTVPPENVRNVVNVGFKWVGNPQTISTLTFTTSNVMQVERIQN